MERMFANSVDRYFFKRSLDPRVLKQMRTELELIGTKLGTWPKHPLLTASSVKENRFGPNLAHQRRNIIFANFICHILCTFFSSLCFDNNRKKQRINSAYYLSEDEKKKKKEKKDKKQIRSVKQKTEHLNTIGGISLTRILYKPLMSDC